MLDRRNDRENHSKAERKRKYCKNITRGHERASLHNSTQILTVLNFVPVVCRAQGHRPYVNRNADIKLNGRVSLPARVVALEHIPLTFTRTPHA